MGASPAKVLTTVVVVVVAVAGAPASALAGPLAQPASHIPAGGVDRTVIAAQAGDSQFFSGASAAVYTFVLRGGRYAIDVYAQYDPQNDPSGSGQCLFNGYLDNQTTGSHAPLGGVVPIGQFVPFHTAVTGTLSAGSYELNILPFTTCDWRVTILDLGPSPTTTVAPITSPVEILAVRSYIVRGTTFTPTTVVHMGQLIDFVVFYDLAAASGPLAGDITIKESGKGAQPPQTFHLNAAKAGVKEFFAGIIFSRKTHDVDGPAVATFTIGASKQHTSRALNFTLAG